MGNTFGELFRLTTFGESHGLAVGGIVDGMPSGLDIKTDYIQRQLDRRRPGQSEIVTARNERDSVRLLSGIFEGKTTGTPIGFEVLNTDQHSGDYDNIRHTFRPSHADYTYTRKYGIRDYRGGGRSSARETVARVVGGAIAMQMLEPLGIRICAYTSQVGAISVPAGFVPDFDSVDNNIVRCPDNDTAVRMIEYIRQVKKQGDTVGGIISGVITGCPAGLGEPVFDKLHARLGAAMLSINAVKGFDYGMGFDGVTKTGSQTIDNFYYDGNRVRTVTNYSGGIQGGISNGESITFRVAFKPVATLLREVDTIDDSGNSTILNARGRHDPCVLPRAVPVVEAMAALVIADMILLDRRLRV